MPRADEHSFKALMTIKRRLMTPGDLATHFQVHINIVYHWTQTPGFPRAETTRGVRTYAVDEVMHWLSNQ